MSTPFLVPTTPGTPQTFNISLSGTSYKLLLKYNTFGEFWVLDIFDNVGNPIYQGIPLVTGADLLEQFDYLDLGGALIVQTTNDPDEVPDFNSLGNNGQLYYVTP